MKAKGNKNFNFTRYIFYHHAIGVALRVNKVSFLNVNLDACDIFTFIHKYHYHPRKYIYSYKKFFCSNIINVAGRRECQVKSYKTRAEKLKKGERMSVKIKENKVDRHCCWVNK